MERFLGAFEHSFWLYDQLQPVHFASTAKLQGSFSLEQLRASLARLQRRHPLLRVRIVLDPTGRPKFVEQWAEIPVRVVTRTDGEQWQQELAVEMSRSFNWRTAPLVRLVLLQSGQDAELILSCHHSIGDGLSGALMLRDIVRGLSDERVEHHPLSAALPIEKTLFNASILDPEVVAQNHVLESDVAVSTRSLPHVRTALLSAELTQNLIMVSRREQTTVHGAIGAAFLLALAKQRETTTSQLKCLSPINVRSHLSLSQPDDVGLYITYGLTHHELSLDSSFWTIARSLKSQLAQLSAPQSLFNTLFRRQQFLSTLPDAPTVSQAMQQQHGYDLLLTNLGRIPLEQQFGDVQISEFYGPAVMTGMEQEQVVGVATWGDRLSLTALSPSATAASATAFLAEGLELLEKMAWPALV
jgi:Condensation domain